MATNHVRARLRVVVCAFAAAVALALPAAPAHASPSQGPEPTAGLGGQAVYDLVVLLSGRVILGGAFTSVGAYRRSNLGAVLANGEADPGFAPTVNGTVHAVAISEDGSRLFIGGTFTAVNGVPRHNLAALDPHTGALVGDWRADTTGGTPMVSSLAVSGDRLYVGGRYAGIDGSRKEKLAAVHVDTGNLIAWDTWVNGGVNEVRVSPDGGLVWIGGEFTRIRGVERPYFGAINAATGRTTRFAGLGNGSRLITLALSPNGRWIYTANNANRVNAYKIDSFAPRWSRHADGNVQAIAGSGPAVYLGGHYTTFDDQGVPRMFFAEVDAYTGALTTWDPRATGANKGVWALVVDGQHLYAGGGFTHFDGERQRLFAKFDGLP